MILRVASIYLAAFLFGGAGLYFASRSQPAPVRRSRLVKFVTYLCIVNSVLFAALAGRWVFTALLIAIVLIGARELVPVLLPAAGGSRVAAGAIAACYLMVSAGATAFAWFAISETAVFIYLIVCTFDGFSQVTGQLLGKHQLVPAISPSKTVEGSIGGMLFAVGMAIALRPLVGFPALTALLATFFIVSAALAGDLMASLIKRRSGIKDFSNFLPGHGGMLDRFDSFLMTAALCFALGLVGQFAQPALHLAAVR